TTLTLPRKGGGDCFQGRTGHPVGAIASSHELALQRCGYAILEVDDARTVTVDRLDGGRLGLEPDLAPVFQALLDQIFDDFLLAVDRDAATGQPAEVDAVLLTRETKVDTVVTEAFAHHSLAHAGRRQEIGRPLFQHAGSHAPFDVVTTPGLEHHRLDAQAMEQVRQHEPGRSRTDDPDLRLIRLRNIAPYPGPPAEGKGGTSADCGDVRRHQPRGSTSAAAPPARRRTAPTPAFDSSARPA